MNAREKKGKRRMKRRSKKEGEREKNGGKADQISSFEENSKSMSKK